MDTFHGSSTNNLTGIAASGVFGGLFSSGSSAVAASHGKVMYVITSPRPLSDFDLNYQVEGAYDIALEIARGDERVADAIMSKGCEVLDDCDPADAGEQGWEFQRLRGQLAVKLGFTSVEMQDEHGTTWLCLPGCSIRLAAPEER